MKGKKINRRNFLKKIANSSLLLFSISSIPDFVLAVEQPLVDNVDSEKKSKTENPFGLPDWFLENRVHAHVRYTLKMMEKNPKFLSEGNKILKDLGAKVIVRHLKTADEGAWWPTKYGKTEPFVKKFSSNLAKEIIDNAHNLGLRIIAYYRHMEDKYIAKEHPDWLCRNWKGNPIKTLTKRGYHLCFNSPYREIVKGRLVELTKMGIDGLYFDENHMPRNGCWCNFCREKFKQEYGLEPPKKPDPKDVIWAKYYVEFNNRTVEETFIEWKKAVKSINPNVVFIISLHLYPTLLDHHLSSRLMIIADSVKSEFRIPVKKKAPGGKDFLFRIPKEYKLQDEVRLALGYTLVRDGANGRPAHIWIPEAITANSAYLSASIVLSTGNVANLNILENKIFSYLKNDFKKVFSLNKMIQNIFRDKNIELFSEIGILFSEKSRNYYIPDYEKAFKEVIYPVYKAFEFLFYRNLQVKIYTDETLRYLNVKFLFVPTFNGLNKIQIYKINRFKEKGGIIFNNLKDFIMFIKKKYKPIFEIKSKNNVYISMFRNSKNSKIYIFISNGERIEKIYKMNLRKLHYYDGKIVYIKPIDIEFKTNLSEKFNLQDLLGNKVRKINNNKYKIENIKYLSALEISKVI